MIIVLVDCGFPLVLVDIVDRVLADKKSMKMACKDDCYLCHMEAPIEWWAYGHKRQDVYRAAILAKEWLDDLPTDPIKFHYALNEAKELVNRIVETMNGSK